MMNRHARRLIVVLAWVALGLACGGGQSGPGEEDTPVIAPAAVLVDTIIEGMVFGKPLSNPYGLAVDFRGTVYLTDAGNNRLITFNSELAPRSEVGGFGAGPGSFDRPGYLAVDNGMSVMIADRGNSRLCRYNSRLQYVNEINLIEFEDPGMFGRPSGVALTDYGEVWMSDPDKDRVVLFDNTGNFDRYIAEFGYSGGQVSSPEAIVSDGRDGFFVCDAGNSRITRYDRFGNFTDALGEDALQYPVSATVDGDGRIWVVDQALSAVTCLDRNGKVLLETGSRLPGATRSLRNPADIVVLSDGRLMISDSGNNRLIICHIVATEN
ncbi:hypothetical protein GF420_06450 [candidate division GN15 bacterium]|nr:hypothetical protein [candidate division GN15 bacterium]